MLYFEIFIKFYFQNILAKGLGGSEDHHRAILDKVLRIIESGEKVPFAFTEMNTSTFHEFLGVLETLGYIGYFASKGKWAPSPTKKDPDGVGLFLPVEMAKQVKVTVPEMIPVSFKEKGKDKKTAAPVIKVTFTDGTYVVITHLKSKTDMSPVRLAQLQAYGVILGDGSVDPECVGLIGDLNEGAQLDLRTGTGEAHFFPKALNPEETLVIQSLDKALMLPGLISYPPTNAKEAKTLKGDRYSGDTREASANGVAYSITDVMAFLKAKITVTTAPVPLTWDEWMATHHSDHAMLCVKLAPTE